MNRLAAILAALAAAAVARAQDSQLKQPQQPPPAEARAPQERPAPDLSADVAALQAKLASVQAQVAELKPPVDASKRLKISGYMQARFAWREDARYTKTTSTTFDPAGDATTQTTTTRDAAPSQDGFYVRRGRIKTTYDADLAQYVLQLDATPGGVGIKEGYASLKLPKGFAIDAGLQLFPFGYEVGTRSSADLDTLERAEFSRTFLKGEYDLGVALRGKYKIASFKVGLFNGDGVDGAKGLDNDPLKDVIGRVTFDLGIVTAGLSGWWGKVKDFTPVPLVNATPKEYDRQRVGGDVQIYLDVLPIGGTAVKGEYLWGKTQLSDKNNGAGDKLGKTSSGWYALVTQNIGRFNQLAVRYEQFTLDHGVDRELPANQGKVFVDAEVQAALHTFVGENYKLTAAWFHPMYAAVGDKVTGAAADPKRDQFIVQAQAKF
ncbi:MAG TPA: porin [Anaeromyxobacter sp.]